ncbi:MAG: hypothetical protein AAF417_16395 [Pseudomonadota bacterium]
MARHLYIALVVAALLAAPEWAAAGAADASSVAPVSGIAWVPDTDADLSAMQQGGPSLDQAIRQVRRRYPNGRIVDAKTSRNGRCDVHRIRVLFPDGKVRTESVRGPCRGR